MNTFERKKEYNFDYPEDMQKIIEYLSNNRTINVTEDIIEKMYYLFSDDQYAASWIDPTEDILEEFAKYIENMDMQDYNALFNDYNDYDDLD